MKLPPAVKPSPAVTRSVRRIENRLAAVRRPELSDETRGELERLAETARGRLENGDARGAALAFVGR